MSDRTREVIKGMVTWTNSFDSEKEKGVRVSSLVL